MPLLLVLHIPGILVSMHLDLQTNNISHSACYSSVQNGLVFPHLAIHYSPSVCIPIDQPPPTIFKHQHHFPHYTPVFSSYFPSPASSPPLPALPNPSPLFASPEFPTVSPPNPCSLIASPYLIFSAVFSPLSFSSALLFNCDMEVASREGVPIWMKLQ